MQSCFDSVVTLIIKTSTDLPPDVRAAMKHALATEDAGSRAGQALGIIGQNIDRKDAGRTHQHGAVQLNAIGGAAQFYARCIDRVEDVSLMEFGTPEEMWHLQLRDFPAIVAMDAPRQ